MTTAPLTPLGVLRELFDSIVHRGGTGTPPRLRKSKWRKRKAANTKAWKDGEAERLACVAACPRCNAWFESTEKRNHHRDNVCPKRPKS